MRDSKKKIPQNPSLSPGGALRHPYPQSEGDLSHALALVYFWQWVHAVWLPKQFIAGFKVAING